MLDLAFYSWTIFLAVLAIQLPLTNSYPAAPTATPWGAGYKPSYNLSAMAEEQLASQSQLDRRQIIGKGVCGSAMQGFSCDMSNHEQNRCAGDGDDYSYCICAGNANGAGSQGLWLNTAWGPGCYACYDSSRGKVFDGTCNGDGTGGTGQCIQDILATLTMTVNVVVVEVPATATVTVSGARRGGRVRRYL